MKAFSALRLLAGASLFSIVGATNSPAQLHYLVVSEDSAHVDSNGNSGVAVDIWFNFSINGAGTIGTLEVIIHNLAGTDKDGILGGPSYTNGELWGFGFDLPGSVATPDNPVMAFNGTFNNVSNTDPDTVVNFKPVIPWNEPSPEGVFDFGAATWSPQPELKSLAGGAWATFTMEFTGTLTNFNAAGFFGQNGSDADFGFRFQQVGAKGNDSDKFVYYDNPPIPEPSTYGIVAALLLLGVVTGKRLRARKAILV